MPALADLVRLVGLLTMKGATVVGGVDRYGAEPSSYAALKARRAISPRFATSTLRIIATPSFVQRHARRSRRVLDKGLARLDGNPLRRYRDAQALLKDASGRDRLQPGRQSHTYLLSQGASAGQGMVRLQILMLLLVVISQLL